MTKEKMRKPIYSTHIPIRWRDIDNFNHVNNSVYFTYFEQARALWWHSINIPLIHIKTGPIILTAECTFLKPLIFPGNLCIEIFTHPPGNSSFVADYEIYLENDPHTLYAKGSTKIVWVDYQQNKSVRLPDTVRKYLPKSREN